MRARERFVLVSMGGGDSCMKLYGMLVVSLKGINQKFWSYLGSVHYKAPLAVKVSYRVHSVLRLNSATLNSRKQGLLCWAATGIESILFKSLPGDFGCGIRELCLYFPTHYSSDGIGAFVIDSAAKTKHSRWKPRLTVPGTVQYQR